MVKQLKDRTWRGKALLDKALVPVHAVASKSAQRLYLSTFLFVVASFFLLASSSVAYAIFYYNYVPQIGVERCIHLQFGHGNPYGTASLPSALTSFQPYDVTVFLHLPRTPSNLAAGNFMIDLSLTSPESAGSAADKRGLSAPESTSVIARSRRPAILTYVSPMVEVASTISGLLWYILGWKKESEALEVSMFEGVEFGKGRKNIPQAVQVVIEADERMQFYDLRVKIIAKLGGLRWFLYHHRIISFVVFTTIFWIISITSALATWFILSFSSSSSSPSSSFPQQTPAEIKSEREDPTIKSECSDSETFDPFSTEDLSDTSRSFPTIGRQTPLLFSARKELRLKEEQREREAMKEEEKYLGAPQGTTMAAAAVAAAAAEADDEDEDGDEADDIVLGPDMITSGTGGWRDSGMGTSLDDGTEVMGIAMGRGRGRGRRRRGFPGEREER